MSRKSEQVKEWRRRTKQRIIDAFGGACCVCNEALPSAVYDFHHVDGTKGFGLGNARGSIKSWGKVVEEARKCVMACANCHRLVHSGDKEVPVGARRFDEKYAYYSPVTYPTLRTKEGKKVYQLIIKKHGHKAIKFISKRPSKERMKALFENNSVVSIGRRFGVSHTTIRRWAKKYKLV